MGIVVGVLCAVFLELFVGELTDLEESIVVFKFATVFVCWEEEAFSSCSSMKALAKPLISIRKEQTFEKIKCGILNKIHEFLSSISHVDESITQGIHTGKVIICHCQ
jgi:hypothetical protein